MIAAPASVAGPMLDGAGWVLPAAGGGFLVQMRPLQHDGDVVVIATAESWVADDMLWDDQLSKIAALRPTPGRTLGDRLLAPSLLRPLQPPGVANTAVLHL